MKRLSCLRGETGVEPGPAYGAVRLRKRTLLAAYASQDDVDQAVGGLIIGGLPSEKISILIPERLGHETGRPVRESLLNGPGGLLDDLTVISLPGLGRFIAAGPFQKAMTGVDGQAHRSAVLTLLTPARESSGPVARARAIVSVECDGTGWASRAKQIFAGTNAEGISFVLNRSATVASLTLQSDLASPGVAVNGAWMTSRCPDPA